MYRLCCVIALLAVATRIVHCQDQQQDVDHTELVRADLRDKVPYLITLTDAYVAAAEAFSDTSVVDLAVAQTQGEEHDDLLKVQKNYEFIQQTRKITKSQRQLLNFANIDWCDNHECSEGSSCLSHETGYTCTCAPGYEGEYCNVVPSRLVFRGDDGKLQIYDLATSLWHDVSEPSWVAGSSALCKLDSSHVVMTGKRSQSSKVAIINVDSGDVDDLPALTESRYASNCIAVDGYLYIFGGHQNSAATTFVHRLSLESRDEWESLPDLDVGTNRILLVSDNTNIYALGGHEVAHEIDNYHVYKYDPTAATMLRGDDLSRTVSSYDQSAILVDSNTILIFDNETVTAYDTELLEERSVEEHNHSGSKDTIKVFKRGEDVLVVQQIETPDGEVGYQLSRFDEGTNNIDMIQVLDAPERLRITHTLLI